ncbi:MAG: aldehyde dehydrogenase [Chloroflexi bacterium]|nr:aldehyde dehydrogenase [Chloroflexota bacterium]
MAKMWIAGEWQDSASGDTYDVINPATGELVESAPKGTREDARRAIDAAEAALGAMAESTAEQRGQWLDKMIELVQAHKPELARTLTMEQGKPVGEAANEIDHFLHGLHFYAGLASKVRGSYVPLPAKGTYGMVMKQPIGVCGGIVPWNFPITLMGTKVGPAIAAGNTIVVKPASTTPLTTLKICALLSEAGLPKGAINCITGPGGVVGEELVENPKVRRIAFTGESATGRHIGEVCGRMLKRVTLELGGSDPMIVCDDADLDRAASMASVGRYYNNGQACLAVKRLFVFDSVFEAFMDKLAPRVKRLKPADPLKPDTRTGPMHNRTQRDEIQAQVEDALGRGAQAVVGGQRLEGGDFARGNWFAPTLLTSVPDDARIVVEESFGPALPVFRVKDLDEAIEKANHTEYGLGSSIWTRNLSHAYKAADKIQAGNVWINSLHYGYDEMPFGGVKASGIGREHGPEALEYYFETKGVVIAVS